MEKITYKQFEREINNIGCHSEDGDSFLYVKHDLIIAAIISKETFKSLNLTYSDSLWAMEESERIKVADLCWQLASTPLEDREEQKRYYLRVRQKYLSFFTRTDKYLNIIIPSGKMLIYDENESSVYKTIFTEGEINELAKEYDLSLFEKVEVEDE